VGDSTQIGVTVSADADDAIAAMGALSGSIERLGTSVSGTAPAFAEAAAGSSAFAHAFDHFGAHEASLGLAEFAGVTGNVGPLARAMTGGIMAGAEGLGLLTGAAAPLVAGLSLLAGVFLLVKGNEDKHTESLAASLKGLEGNVAAIDDYVAAGGRLTAALQKERDMEQAAALEIVKKIEAQTKATLADDEAALKTAQTTQAYLQRTAARNGDTMGLAAYALEVKKHQDAVTEDTNTLAANEHGFATWQEYVKSGTTVLKEHTKAVAEAEAAEDKAFAVWSRGIDQMNQEEAAYGRNYEAITKFIAKKDEEAQKLNAGPGKDDKIAAQYQAQVEAAQQAYDQIREKAGHSSDELEAIKASETQYMAALSRNRAMKEEEDTRASFGLQATDMLEFESTAKSVAQSFESGFANAFAQALVNGKSFTQGGTAPSNPCHFDMTVNYSPQVLANAINQIRGSLLGCVFDLPQPDGGTVNLDEVNVEYSTDGTTYTQLARRASPTETCTTGNGCWDYDSSGRIVLIGPACSSVENAPSGDVEIVVGCQTMTQ